MPGSASPIIDPGLAQWTVTVSPVGELDVGEEALVAADQPAFGEGGGEAHAAELWCHPRAVRHSPPSRGNPVTTVGIAISDGGYRFPRSRE